MKTMKMPIIEKEVTKTPYEVYTILHDFVEGEVVGLEEDCEISSGFTVSQIYETLDSLQFYLAQAREPSIMPLKYQVIDDTKFHEELKKQCQE